MHVHIHLTFKVVFELLFVHFDIICAHYSQYMYTSYKEQHLVKREGLGVENKIKVGGTYVHSESKMSPLYSLSP